MNKQFFNMLLSKKKILKDPEDAIVFTASEIYNNNYYFVNEHTSCNHIWNETPLLTTIEGKEYIKFTVQAGGKATNEHDKISIDTRRRNNLRFKVRDYPFIKIGYRTNIHNDDTSEDESQINVAVHQTEKWQFSTYSDNRIFPHIKKPAVNREEAHVDSISHSSALSSAITEAASSYVESLRFLPHWYRSRNANEDLEFDTVSGDYFAIEYIAFFKNMYDAINSSIGTITPSYDTSNLLSIASRAVVDDFDGEDSTKRILTGSGIIVGLYRGNSWDEDRIINYETLTDDNGFQAQHLDQYCGVGVDLRITPNTTYSYSFMRETGAWCNIYLLEYNENGEFLQCTEATQWSNIGHFYEVTPTHPKAYWGVFLNSCGSNRFIYHYRDLSIRIVKDIR